jgi:hypothetical protein
MAPPRGLHDRHRSPEDRQDRRTSHGQDDTRANQAPFALEPPAASGDFACVWGLVKTPLTALFVFEVLDSVGDPRSAARHAGGDQGPVENLSRWSDERQPRQVFGITRLCAHQHHRRRRRSLAGDPLGCVSP